MYYECNICLETATNAVVTRCGHLFCWPCLHQWFLTWPDPKRCPVCRSHINEQRVVRINGGRDLEDDLGNEGSPLASLMSWICTALRIIRCLFLPFCLFILFSRNLEDPRPMHSDKDDIVEAWKLYLYMALPCIGWLLYS